VLSPKDVCLQLAGLKDNDPDACIKGPITLEMIKQICLMKTFRVRLFSGEETHVIGDLHHDDEAMILHHKASGSSQSKDHFTALIPSTRIPNGRGFSDSGCSVWKHRKRNKSNSPRDSDDEAELDPKDQLTTRQSKKPRCNQPSQYVLSNLFPPLHRKFILTICLFRLRKSASQEAGEKGRSGPSMMGLACSHLFNIEERRYGH
jgi:hypothetical protein